MHSDDPTISPGKPIERHAAVPLERLPYIVALAVGAVTHLFLYAPNLIDVTPAEFRRAKRDPCDVHVRYLRGKMLSPMTIYDINDILLAIEIADDAPIFPSLLPATLIEYLRQAQSEKRLFFPPEMPKSPSAQDEG